jgi:hypothetical protein
LTKFYRNLSRPRPERRRFRDILAAAGDLGGRGRSGGLRRAARDRFGPSGGHDLVGAAAERAAAG